jgi:RND family efflux transporter MFP subunit
MTNRPAPIIIGKVRIIVSETIMPSVSALVRVACLLSVSFLMVGCEEEAVPVQERVRAIKPYTVVEPTGGSVRRYSGTVVAANSSSLSFAVSGTVADVKVKKGDVVEKGQVLATLDSRSLDLEVQAARSQLAAARADAAALKADLDRKQELFRKGWVTRAAIDNASGAYQAASGQLNLSRSKLGIAEREQAKADLRAPFEGVIAVSDIENFTEVTKGEPVFQIDSGGGFEVDLAVSDTVVGQLSIGSPVAIEASAASGCGCTARVTEIGTQAGAANTVPVTAAIIEGSDQLVAGMAVEAALVLSDGAETRGFLVPLVAIAPGDDASMGYIFKFDPSSGVVRKTAIANEGVINGNFVGISEGVSAGDVIAAAGVSLLRDGQSVKLLGN